MVVIPHCSMAERRAVRRGGVVEVDRDDPLQGQGQIGQRPADRRRQADPDHPLRSGRGTACRALIPVPASVSNTARSFLASSVAATRVCP